MQKKLSLKHNVTATRPTSRN